MGWTGRHLPTIFIALGVCGLWLISSAGVEEGLRYGPGRWWVLFVAVKAGSGCAVLFVLMTAAGGALRNVVRLRSALMAQATFHDGDGR